MLDLWCKYSLTDLISTELNGIGFAVQIQTDEMSNVNMSWGISFLAKFLCIGTEQGLLHYSRKF